MKRSAPAPAPIGEIYFIYVASSFILFTSSMVNLFIDPAPLFTPPELLAPGNIIIRLEPNEAICSCTCSNRGDIFYICCLIFYPVYIVNGKPVYRSRTFIYSPRVAGTWKYNNKVGAQ